MQLFFKNGSTAQTDSTSVFDLLARMVHVVSTLLGGSEGIIFNFAILKCINSCCGPQVGFG